MEYIQECLANRRPLPKGWNRPLCLHNANNEKITINLDLAGKQKAGADNKKSGPYFGTKTIIKNIKF